MDFAESWFQPFKKLKPVLKLPITIVQDKRGWMVWNGQNIEKNAPAAKGKAV
jgi:hypothetical protein